MSGCASRGASPSGPARGRSRCSCIITAVNVLPDPVGVDKITCSGRGGGTFASASSPKRRATSRASVAARMSVRCRDTMSNSACWCR
eukprot:364913-Chlamydomonas_euryale.AAC.10